ncbi:putative ammonium transporter 1 isoform X2 [Mizuhopecten yessoensis]|uniref:Ammonium transporter n=1 Tax=Mizuhopecten yessoensis TaxID=6573 RepID=A0A210PLF2_MIZYE|nr:putative ammonium transporter 1 isoform X2 [Mizuhopecten yessoensis]OWF37328.1 ammonium transporter 1 [Mizuhopecten yessoensis]
MASVNESLMALKTEVEVLKEWQSYTNDNMDQFFLITMGTIIYLMQGGFALLEAGSVRSKNTTNILIKNLLDSFISGVCYWLFGYAFAFGGGNAFIGTENFAHSNLEDTEYAYWFFHFVFAATAATIVSGAVAERCDFVAYLVYSSLITGFIYPVLTHWAWSSEGWLLKGFTYTVDNETTIDVSYNDFAGSGVVHMLGGIAAFTAALIMGPRIGRFDKDTGAPEDIKGHSVPLSALGGFILLFGFFAFNGSSQGAISNEGDGAAVATAVKNTVISGSSGALVTLIMNRLPFIGDKKWSFLTTLNGALTGMVSVCGAANQIETYGALCIGAIGGCAYMITTWVVLFKFKVDDPLDATAVHFGGGTWGVIAVAFFSTDFGILYHWDTRSGLYLAWQLVGVLAIVAWGGILCVLMFFILKKLNLLRVSFEYEMKGLDIPKHGEPAYPVEAYGHGWEEKGDTLRSMIKKSTTTFHNTMIGLPMTMDAKPKRAGDIKSMESNSSLSSIKTDTTLL